MDSTGEFLLEPLPDQPACLLLDVQLPGPSGLELQAALQRRNVEIPVIFLTGHADIASSVTGDEGRRRRLSRKAGRVRISSSRRSATRSLGKNLDAQPAKRRNDCANVLICSPLRSERSSSASSPASSTNKSRTNWGSRNAQSRRDAPRSWRNWAPTRSPSSADRPSNCERLSNGDGRVRRNRPTRIGRPPRES